MPSMSTHVQRGKFSAYKRMIAGQRFYFGAEYGIREGDLQRALTLADAIDLYYRSHVKPLPWTAETTEAAKAFAKGFAVQGGTLTPLEPQSSILSVPIAKAAPSRSVQQTALTVDDAIAVFLRERSDDVAANRIQYDQWESLQCRLKASQTAGLFSGIPLAAVGRNELKAAIDYWLKRPVSKKHKRPIAVQTVRNNVGALRQFYYWADNAGKWQGFGGFRSLFEFDESNLRKPKEAKEQRDGKARYTVDELKALWRRMNKRQKCYCLLGLNCGMGAKEIATLRTWDIDLEKGIIDRERNKTGVQGVWELWPETIKYLRSAMEESATTAARYGKEDEGYALLTEQGNPLVHRCETSDGAKGRKTDAIGLAWKRLQPWFGGNQPKNGIYKYCALEAPNKRPKIVGVETPLLDDKGQIVSGMVRRMGFYSLRRTAGQMIRNIAGYETHKVFLAHATLEASGRQSVSEKHYSDRDGADFDRVAAALREMRKRLAPVFKTENTKRKEAKTEAA